MAETKDAPESIAAACLTLVTLNSRADGRFRQLSACLSADPSLLATIRNAYETGRLSAAVPFLINYADRIQDLADDQSGAEMSRAYVVAVHVLQGSHAQSPAGDSQWRAVRPLIGCLLSTAILNEGASALLRATEKLVSAPATRLPPDVSSADSPRARATSQLQKDRLEFLAHLDAAMQLASRVHWATDGVSVVPYARIAKTRAAAVRALESHMARALKVACRIPGVVPDLQRDFADLCAAALDDPAHWLRDMAATGYDGLPRYAQVRMETWVRAAIVEPVARAARRRPEASASLPGHLIYDAPWSHFINTCAALIDRTGLRTALARASLVDPLDPWRHVFQADIFEPSHPAQQALQLGVFVAIAEKELRAAPISGLPTDPLLRAYGYFAANAARQSRDAVAALVDYERAISRETDDSLLVACMQHAVTLRTQTPTAIYSAGAYVPRDDAQRAAARFARQISGAERRAWAALIDIGPQVSAAKKKTERVNNNNNNKPDAFSRPGQPVASTDLSMKPVKRVQFAQAAAGGAGGDDDDDDDTTREQRRIALAVWRQTQPTAASFIRSLGMGVEGVGFAASLAAPSFVLDDRGLLALEEDFCAAIRPPNARSLPELEALIARIEALYSTQPAGGLGIAVLCVYFITIARHRVLATRIGLAEIPPTVEYLARAYEIMHTCLIQETVRSGGKLTIWRSAGWAAAKITGMYESGTLALVARFYSGAKVGVGALAWLRSYFSTATVAAAAAEALTAPPGLEQDPLKALDTLAPGDPDPSKIPTAVGRVYRVLETAAAAGATPPQASGPSSEEPAAVASILVDAAVRLASLPEGTSFDVPTADDSTVKLARGAYTAGDPAGTFRLLADGSPMPAEALKNLRSVARRLLGAQPKPAVAAKGGIPLLRSAHMWIKDALDYCFFYARGSAPVAGLEGSARSIAAVGAASVTALRESRLTKNVYQNIDRPKNRGIGYATTAALAEQVLQLGDARAADTPATLERPFRAILASAQMGLSTVSAQSSPVALSDMGAVAEQLIAGQLHLAPTGTAILNYAGGAAGAILLAYARVFIFYTIDALFRAILDESDIGASTGYIRTWLTFLFVFITQAAYAYLVETNFIYRIGTEGAYITRVRGDISEEMCATIRQTVAVYRTWSWPGPRWDENRLLVENRRLETLCASALGDKATLDAATAWVEKFMHWSGFRPVSILSESNTGLRSPGFYLFDGSAEPVLVLRRHDRLGDPPVLGWKLVEGAHTDWAKSVAAQQTYPRARGELSAFLKTAAPAVVYYRSDRMIKALRARIASAPQEYRGIDGIHPEMRNALETLYARMTKKFMDRAVFPPLHNVPVDAASLNFITGDDAQATYRGYASEDELRFHWAYAVVSAVFGPPP